MPKRISETIVKSLIIASQTTPASQRQLAEQFGISRSSVAAIQHDPAGLRYKRDGVAVSQQPVEFKPVLPYYCDECERTVNVSPCPACVAREAKRNGAKSAVAEIRDQKLEVLFTQPNRRECTPWIEIPPAVSDWFHARLSHMIGREGRHDDVAEAIEAFSAQFRNLIVAAANTIGQERREKRLQQIIGSNAEFQNIRKGGVSERGVA